MTRHVCAALLVSAVSLSLLRADNSVEITVAADKSHVDFKVGSQSVATYHIGLDVAKPYLYPLNAPGGVPVTRGWPMVKGLPKESTDHVHQKSAWFCHGDVIPDGVTVVPSSDKHVKGVDFWSEGKGHGVIACAAATVKGNVLTTMNQWCDSGGTQILEETRTITLTATADGYLFAFDIALTANVCPLTFGDTKEGSFGVRVNDQIRLTAKGEKSALVNADGKSGSPVWGLLSDWCDYSGEIDGKPAGVAVFDHPKNAPRAAWHSRDYGLMAANPFGRNGSGFPAMKGNNELTRLDKGETLKLRYGIFTHAGDAKSGKVAEAYQVFAK